MKCVIAPNFHCFFHPCFGEILVFVTNIFGNIHVFDDGFAAHGMEGGGGEVEESACLAGAEVEDTVGMALTAEPVQYIHHVHYIDEVAALLAVGVVGAVRAEQLHFAGFVDLVERMEDDGGHATFMVFVGAINVEELEAGPCGRGGLLPQDPLVDFVLDFP